MEQRLPSHALNSFDRISGQNGTEPLKYGTEQCVHCDIESDQRYHTRYKELRCATVKEVPITQMPYNYYLRDRNAAM